MVHTPPDRGRPTNNQEGSIVSDKIPIKEDYEEIIDELEDNKSQCHFLPITCKFPISEEDLKILIKEESPTSLSQIPSPETDICMNCLLGFIAGALMPNSSSKGEM